MNPKALTTLEFDKVLARLAALAQTPMGRELALALRPSADHAEVVRRQRQTAEARRLLSAKPNLGLADAPDVRPLARKADLGGVLEPQELLDIAAALRTAQAVRNVVGRMASHLPLLAAIVNAIPDLAPLAAAIARCIGPRGEVTDAASPLLAELRRQLQHAHDLLLAHLQAFLRSPLGRQVAQEPFITLRDGRYVVPVKAEMRGHVRGVVHDVSESGATVFLEPLEAVDLGNQWREFQTQERHEVERVLRRLSAQAGHAADAVVATVEALAELDLALAKARLGEALGARDLPYDGEGQPWLAEAPAELRLLDARHPLLTGDVVPVSLTVGGAGTEASLYRILLITGPNTGGKTVVLKTAGLLALMAQAGLPVPAAVGSRLPVFDGVCVDIGDEQSIEQSLSTFSSHMGNIIEILRQATPRSLVLLDELGAGTDPSEGTALAQAVLQHLLERSITTIATTHHGQLKVFAHVTSGVMNASVEFDPVTLAPTYRLRIGLPGQSNALAIAARLGMPDAIVAQAQAALSPDQVRLAELLAEIQRQHDEAVAARRAEEQARREAEEMRARLSQRLAALEGERAALLAEAQQELQRELAEAKRHLRAAQHRLERAAHARPELVEGRAAAEQDVAAAEKDIAAAQQEVVALRRRQRRRVGAAPEPPLRPGDQVWLRGLARPGQVISAPDADGQLEVQLGPVRTRVPLEQVQRAEPAAAGPEPIALPEPVEGRAVPPELDLRGLRADEALARLDRYLDEAFRAGLAAVRIIHGHGTGILRQQVRQMLSQHPLVKSFAPAEPRAGGEGATVVELAI